MGRTSDAKDRLLTAARELILEQGYHAVGVAEICQRAEVNKGSFYHFFRSKQKLAQELVEVTWGCVRESLDELLAQTQRSPLERLREHLSSIHQNHRDDRARRGCTMGCPFGNLAVEMSVHDPELRRQLAAIFEGQSRRYQQLLEQAREAGELPAQLATEADLAAAAFDILTLIQGRVLLAKAADDPSQLQSLETSALRLLGLSAAAHASVA